MAVSREKVEQLKKRMEALGIRDEDLTERFILGSGKGGQKVNKTASCVYLKHIPSGIEVKCQQARSRELNRFTARRELCERIESKVLKRKTAKQQEFEKLRRQKRRRSRRSKERMLDDKKAHSDKKQMRKPPRCSD